MTLPKLTTRQQIQDWQEYLQEIGVPYHLSQTRFDEDPNLDPMELRRKDWRGTSPEDGR